MSNLDAKFGPAPAFHAAPPLPSHVVLLGQLVACVALLLVVQPPFVRAPGEPFVDMARVLGASVATVGATWLMHCVGAKPADTFRGACELLYRAARA